ncbi:MAG: MFS transporter, partial [Actinomycetota bacterium]
MKYGKYSALSAILIGQLAGPLDGAMVNVSLPTIGEELGISISATGWVMVIYFLFSASFMVSFGRLGDLAGRRKIFCYGLLIFAASSAAGGLSVNYGMLVTARAVQALGSGMFTATLPALVTSTFPEKERGKALGITSTTVSVSLAVGPFLGGMISGTLGWRYVFFITPVLAVLSASLCRRFVPESHVSYDESMDVYGAFLLLALLAPAILALGQGRYWGWGSPATVGLVLIALCMAWLFARHERSAIYPVIDLKLFRIPTFTLSNLASAASYVAFQAVVFSTPFFLQYYKGMPPQAVGLIVAVANTTSLLFLFPSGILSDRIGTMSLELIGMFFVILCLALLAMAGSELTLLIIILALLSLGAGYGLFRSPNYSAVMGSVPRASLGVAGGVYGTMRHLGLLTGIAMASTMMGEWAVKRQVAEGAGSALNNPSFQAAVRNAYMAGFLVALLGLLLLAIKYFYLSSGRETIGRRNYGV